MWIFGPPDVEKLKSKKNLKGLIKTLNYKKDITMPSVPNKRNALSKKIYGYGNIRCNAAEALGQMGDVCAVEPLIIALKDSNWSVRQAAAKALGKIGDTRAIGPLVTEMMDGSLDATEALEEIGDARVVDPLITALKNKNKKICLAAAKALGSIRDIRAVKPLITELKSGNEHFCQVATEALVKIGVPAMDDLALALKDSNHYVRMNAAKVLGQIGDTRAVDLLAAALKDNNAGVRRAAVGALDHFNWLPGQDENGAAYWIVKQEWGKCAQIGVPAIEPLITALEGGDKNTRQAAAETLGQIGDARAVEPLLAVLKNKYEKENVRMAAIDTLGRLSDGSAIGPLATALEDISWNIRKAAATALVKIYSCGVLSIQHQLTILSYRQLITRTHQDDNSHYDGVDWRCVNHTDTVSVLQDSHADNSEHTDIGIGVDFHHADFQI